MDFVWYKDSRSVHIERQVWRDRRERGPVSTSKDRSEALADGRRLCRTCAQTFSALVPRDTGATTQDASRAPRLVRAGVDRVTGYIYGKPIHRYAIEFESASGKRREVHGSWFLSEQAAQRAMEVELAALAAGEYDEAPEPEPVPDPQLNFDDELADLGLPQLGASDSPEIEP